MEFLIASKMNGQVIDIRQGGDGGGLVVAPATSSASQRWSLVPAGDGCFYVQNTGSGQVIDICGGDTSPAAPYVFAVNDGGVDAGDRDFNDLVVTIQVYASAG